MGSSHQLYTRVFAVLRQFHPTLHAKRLANWTWVIHPEGPRLGACAIGSSQRTRAASG